MKKIILILTILISGIVSAKSLELQRPENIDDENWVNLKMAIEGKLLPSGGGTELTRFGFSVSLSRTGNLALIGAPANGSGVVYVFNKNDRTGDGDWNLVQKITADDGAAGDEFGVSVSLSLSGNRALIGALGDDDNGNNSGSAYVFDFFGSNWNQTQKITAVDGDSSDQFGRSVSLSGNKALIGAFLDDDNGSSSGSAYVFDFDGNSWSQAQKITAADAGTGDRFGYSVSLSGNRALIGAFQDDDNGDNSGAAYLFEFNGNSWDQDQKIRADDGDAGDQFGISVNLGVHAYWAVIGAYLDDDNGDDSGSAYVFHNNGSGWNQSQKIRADDGDAGDRFGVSVSIRGSRVLVGAYLDDDNGNNSGSAYVFGSDGISWSQIRKIKVADGNAGDEFGFSVSLSTRALIGSFRDDDNGNGSGSAYVFIDDSIFTNGFEFMPRPLL